MDFNKEQKQSYLRQQILEKGYQPQQFVPFLNKQLNINSDLDKCTLLQLQETVKKFIKHKMDQYEQSDHVSVLFPDNQNSQKVSKPKTILFNNYVPPVKQEQFQQVAKCIKIQDKYPDKRNIKIEVNSPERKYVYNVLGISTTSFLEFKVQTHGLDWTVGRRYSDFIWLRNALLKFYPAHIIPPIPNKKASKRTARQIEKRMRILSYFLNDLVQVPEFFNSKYVEGFLSIQDNSKFQQLKKQADSKKTFESIYSDANVTGKVTIKLNERYMIYGKNLEQFVKEAQLLYKSITRNSKSLQRSMIHEVNTLYEMGDQFRHLHEVASQFNEKVKTDSLASMNNIFIKLNNLMIEWGNNIRNEVGLLELNMNTFFKYMRQQFMGFKELIQKEKQIQQQWALSKAALQRKKQKIFQMYDVNKWELPPKQISYLPKSCVHERGQAFKIMLPKQSIAVQELKKKMSFYQTKIFEDSQRCFKRNVEKICQNFKEFTIKNKVNSQQMGELWVQLATSFSNPTSKVGKLKIMDKIQDRQQSQIQYDE